MADHLLAIGMFIFGLPRLVYEEMQQRASWRWATSDRVGARPATQFLGPGDDTISLSGVLVPEIAGSFSDIARIKEMAASGEVCPVVLGTGEVLGDYRIEAVDTRGKSIVAGGLARMTDFAIDLVRVDDGGA